ncbi:MAG: hypothetical protein JKY43_05220 [Phycisphaerales bacterium]|nr:hypothetical protein [Phycisphaerales bacterium]
MPQYTILLFGPAAAAITMDRVVIQSAELCSADQLKVLMIQQFPALDVYLDAGRLAVNQSFVIGETIISTSDETALITMVSGG